MIKYSTMEVFRQGCREEFRALGENYERKSGRGWKLFGFEVKTMWTFLLKILYQALEKIPARG